MSKFLNSTEWILWTKSLPELRLLLPVSKPRTGLLCSSQASCPSQVMVCRCSSGEASSRPSEATGLQPLVHRPPGYQHGKDFSHPLI